MEVMVGEERDDSHLRDFLETRFVLVPLDAAIAEVAVQLRRKHGARLPDAIIWATARTQMLYW